MAKTANEEILDATVRHQIRLLRFTQGEAASVVAILDRSDAELEAALRETLDGPAKARLEKTLKEVRRLRAAAAERVYSHIDASSEKLAPVEADWEKSMLEGATPVSVAYAGVPPATLKAISGSPINGVPLSGWIGQMASNDVHRVEQQVRLGILQGETTDQIVRRVRGTKAAGYSDGVLKTTQREAEMIARTTANHVSTSARQATWDANSDIIKGVRWVATLDGRTSPVCQSRDGEVYKVDEGPRPPAHPNCRSTVAPVLDGEQIVGTRSTITDTRTRKAREVDFRQEAKEAAGKGWKDMSAAERNAAIKARRDAWAKANVGEAPSTTNYESWLRGQPKEFQDSVLGQGKAKLFRDGASLDKFVDEQGHPYSLQQLQTELAGDKLNVVQPGVGLKAKALLQQGLDSGDVLKQIQAEFPEASTSAASIASYKSELKKIGALDLPQHKVPSAAIKKAQSVAEVVDGLDASLPAGVKSALGGQWATVVDTLEGSPGAYGYYQAGKGVTLSGSKLAQLPAAQARQVAAHELGHLLHKQHELLLPDDILSAAKLAAKQLSPDARKLYSYYLSSPDELVAEVYAQALSPSVMTSQGLGAAQFTEAFGPAIDAAKQALAEKFPLPAANLVKPVPGGPVLPYEVAGKHTSVGTLAKALLQQGMPDADVLKSVLAEFPEAKTKQASIASYKSELKKKGLLPNKASGQVVNASALPDVMPAPPAPKIVTASPQTAALKPSTAALTEKELKAKAEQLFSEGSNDIVEVAAALNKAYPNAAIDLYPSKVGLWKTKWGQANAAAKAESKALAQAAEAKAAAAGPTVVPELAGKQLGALSKGVLEKLKSYFAAGGGNDGAYDIIKAGFGDIKQPGADNLIALAKHDLATAKAAGKPYLDAAFSKAPAAYDAVATAKGKEAIKAYQTAIMNGTEDFDPVGWKYHLKTSGFTPEQADKMVAFVQNNIDSGAVRKGVTMQPSRPASTPREGLPPPPRFTSQQRRQAIDKITGGSAGYTAKLDKLNREQKRLGLEALEPEELASIKAYTGSHYRTLNSALRSGKYASDNQLQAYVDAAQHGLAKLPKFNGLSSRGMTMSSEQVEKMLKAYQPGSVVEESAFISTSSGDTAAFSGNVYIKIRGRSGVDVSSVSLHPGEREVLLPPGVRLRVDKVEKINDKYVINMTEV